MTLKAFQKNAVQSYFERQQQQRQQQQQQRHQHQHQHYHPQQQTSPIKETTESLKNLRSNHVSNGQTNMKSPANSNHINGISTNGTTTTTTITTNVIRPQSMPVASKMTTSMESIPQTRLSLPNRLSQIINLTTQLAAQKQQALSNGSVDSLDRQSDRMNCSVKSTAVKLPVKQTTRPTIINVDKNNLQSINESGVPPPPPRRSNRVMPVRR